MSKKNVRVALIEKVTGKRIKLGGYRKSDRQPPKAQIYNTNRFQAAELPPKVDLRGLMTPVEDQAQTNSCVANAIAGAYEYLAQRHLGEAGDISRLFIYYNARALMGWQNKDEGSTISGSIQVLEEMGACTEETWPYQPERVNDKPPAVAYEEALNFLVDEAREIKVDLYVMKHCLAEGYPFVFGVDLYQSFDRAGNSGRVPLPSSDEIRRETHAGHAMLCVGYSDKSQAFIVRNSWGESWGDRGYCYVPYNYLTNPELCGDCWAIHKVTDLDFSADGWEEDEEDYYRPGEEEEANYTYAYENEEDEEDKDDDEEDYDDEDYDDEDYDDEDYDDEDEDEDEDDEDYDDEDYDDEDYDDEEDDDG